LIVFKTIFFINNSLIILAADLEVGEWGSMPGQGKIFGPNIGLIKPTLQMSILVARLTYKQKNNQILNKNVSIFQEEEVWF